MSYGDVVVLLAAGFGMALLLAAGVLRFIRLETRRRHNEVGATVFLQVGVMFAVLLAFVFNEVWSEYNVAEQAVVRECAALHDVVLVSAGLAAPIREPIRRAVLGYARQVADGEWPVMRAKRRIDPVASRDFANLVKLVATLNVTRPSDVGVESQMLSLLAEAHAERESRLFQMAKALPSPLWAILFVYTVILVGFVATSGVETVTGHMVFTAAFTLCTALVLVLIRMLDHPFEGVLAIGNGDFLELIARVGGDV